MAVFEHKLSRAFSAVQGTALNELVFAEKGPR